VHAFILASQASEESGQHPEVLQQPTVMGE